MIMLILLTLLTLFAIIAFGIRLIGDKIVSLFSPREKEIKRTEQQQPAEKDDFKVGDLSDAKEVDFKKE